MRLLAKPGLFFNQLQWSRRHWLIMVAFLGIAIVETQVGRQAALYTSFASLVQHRWHLSLDQASWVVMALRLALLLVGSFVVVTSLWLVSNLVGRRNSRRVLARRLAIVFTVFLAAYTTQHLQVKLPQLVVVTFALYAWGVVLGYFALREQFAMNHVETAIVSLIAIGLVTGTWHVTNNVAAHIVRSEVHAVPAPVLAAPKSIATQPRLSPRSSSKR